MGFDEIDIGTSISVSVDLRYKILSALSMLPRTDQEQGYDCYLNTVEQIIKIQDCITIKRVCSKSWYQ